MRWLICLLGAALCLVACQENEPPPLPTALLPDQAATDLAVEQTQTQSAFLLLPSATQGTTSPTPTATWTLTPTPSPFLSFTPRPSATPSITFTPSITPTERPPFLITATPSHTATFTPSASPTRATNPDAVVTGQAAPLRIEPDLEAQAITELAVNTALRIEGRTSDNLWLRVSLMSGLGDGWIQSANLVVFIDLDSILVLGGAAPPSGQFTLVTPQMVSTQTVGNGVPFRAYDFAACGDTYWGGDEVGLSMEDLAYQGRYPRFGRSPIRVYVHGSNDLQPSEAEAWELAISQAFAELSQAVTLERVYSDDLEFFQPTVPMAALLQDSRVEMVWHLVTPEEYTQSAICTPDTLSCSQYTFEGAVRGGPLKFASMIYIRADAPDPRLAILQAVLPALGLWVQSTNPQDVAAPLTQAERLSARDIASLRCLYNAPPYGDGNVRE